jgi:hypothetical protein
MRRFTPPEKGQSQQWGQRDDTARELSYLARTRPELKQLALRRDNSSPETAQNSGPWLQTMT